MLSEPPKSTHYKTDPSSSDNAGSDIYEDIGLPTCATKWEIKWKNLVIEDKILGKGNFGEVRAGEVKIKGGVTKAAVKKLKGKTRNSERYTQTMASNLFWIWRSRFTILGFAFC